MISLISKCVILSAIFCSGWSYAQNAGSSINAPMQIYEASNGGNCIGCSWIAAEGTFVKGTADLFENFFDNYTYDCPEVVINSKGGNLIEALAVGNILRRSNCSITIGRTFVDTENANYHDNDFYGECYSACAFAFLGGIRREIGDNAKYGVHQHYNLESILSPLSDTLNALEISASHIVSGILVAYVMDMGADPLLVSLALMTPFVGDMHILSKNELKKLKIITNIEDEVPKWKLVLMKNGLVAAVDDPHPPSARFPVGKSQSAEIYCNSKDPDKAFITIRQYLYDQEMQIATEVEKAEYLHFNIGGQRGRVKRGEYSVTIDEVSNNLIITASLSQQLLEYFKSAENFEWNIESSRLVSGYLFGEISIIGAYDTGVFALKHCI